MTAAPRFQHDDRPQEDHIVVLRNATWADFQRVLEIRGDTSGPRISYSKGKLEIMSPSASHEEIKSVIGRLVEVYCLERGIDFTSLGSWTLEDEPKEVGIEPDECYVFGALGKKAPRPDLAIEVVWTSGGIRKLDAYALLGVREVWFWKRGVITVHVLRGEAYEDASASEALAGIDLVELARHLDEPTTSAAIRAYRDSLRR